MDLQVVRLRPEAILPARATSGSTGYDLHACLPETLLITATARRWQVVQTGLAVAVPKGYDLQIRPRSGLASKHGIIAALGTIDSDYRGELLVILQFPEHVEATIRHGDRIAQLVLTKCEPITWTVTETLLETKRGSGGLGSTGA